MKKLSRALAITLLAATVPATIVLADPEPSDQKSEQGEVKRGPSPETLARLWVCQRVDLLELLGADVAGQSETLATAAEPAARSLALNAGVDVVAAG